MSRADENGMNMNDCKGKPNLVEQLAESTDAASVSIRASWSSIEQVSDIVFVQILHFVYADFLHYG